MIPPPAGLPRTQRGNSIHLGPVIHKTFTEHYMMDTLLGSRHIKMSQRWSLLLGRRVPGQMDRKIR